ncbi:MAG TPA: sigma-70 family RNA polymerase sigma factor [Thermomicrobiaceae bacterium]|nr:sigma-70 family RNA polymerase sigma factor [Thermomicrobiaceae bacterium]
MGASVRSLAGMSTAGPIEAPEVEPRTFASDERRLVEAARQGDAEAFALLYDRHLDRVYRHCYYRTASRPDAEDLAQQTFLQAWQAIGRYRDGGAPFVAWLLTISDRLAISHHRRRREVSVPELEVPQAAGHEPEHLVARSLEADEVRRALLRLKPERQQVIVLRFIDGFSVREVAAALGKRENNVCVIQHRALAELRGMLEGSSAGERPPCGLIDRVRGAVGRAVRDR